MGRRNLAIMLDTKGPEVRSGDVTQPLELRAGETVTFTIVAGADGTNNRIGGVGGAGWGGGGERRGPNGRAPPLLPGAPSPLPPQGP